MSDLLTGLASRHQLHIALPELAATADIGKPLALLLLKITDFSLWQRKLTPLTADHLLRLTAEFLLQQAPKDALVARWNGPTFALLLPDTPLWQAEEIGEALAQAALLLDLPSLLSYEGLELNMSYGCATLPPHDIWRLPAAAEHDLSQSAGGAFNALLLSGNADEQEAERRAFVKLAKNFLAHGDKYLQRHGALSADLALETGRRLGLGETDLADLALAAAFADIAMGECCGSTLNKPGTLTQGEWFRIRRHPALAARLCRILSLGEDVEQAVHFHHERYDGLGYPEKLQGEQIPLKAAILHAAGTYAALLLPRPYRPACKAFAAKAELSLLAGNALHPQVVQQLLLLDAQNMQRQRPRLERASK